MRPYKKSPVTATAELPYYMLYFIALIHVHPDNYNCERGYKLPEHLPQ